MKKQQKGYGHGDWRKRQHTHEREYAHDIRRTLQWIGHYAPKEWSFLEDHVQDNRAALREIILDLDCFDLECVYRIARLMALTPRGKNFFNKPDDGYLAISIMAHKVGR